MREADRLTGGVFSLKFIILLLLNLYCSRYDIPETVIYLIIIIRFFKIRLEG